MNYKKTVLKNGLTVVEVPSQDAESVVVNMMVKTGSRHELPKEHGISHFLEHFLFKGTQKYPTALAINEIVDGLGGEMNAFTSKETTQYFIKAASQHFELIFKILTDMLLHPLLDADELEKEKGVIVEEMNMYKDMPQAHVGDILENTMWPKTSLGAEIIGTKKTVTAFTVKMFKDYLARFYQPSNIIIGIGGKYNEKQLHSLLKELWEPVKNKKVPKTQKVKDSQKTIRLAGQNKPTEQSHVNIGFKSYPHRHKNYSALLVLSAILGGGMSGRLFMEVREKRGLAYYVRCGPGQYIDTGYFVISAGVQVDKIEEALSVISTELSRSKSEPVGEEELLKAKNYLKGRAVLGLEDNQSRLDWFLDQIAFKEKVNTPQEAFKLVDMVTAGDVVRVAKEILQTGKLSFAVVGPYSDPKKFSKFLKIN